MLICLPICKRARHVHPIPFRLRVRLQWHQYDSGPAQLAQMTQWETQATTRTISPEGKL
jgi:hypothetical protein